MKNQELYNDLEVQLDLYQANNGSPLGGILNPNAKKVFIKQLIDSIRRVQYIRTISSKEISVRRIDPNDEIFDPIRAACWHLRNGNIDEAFWLVFLLTHFGKHLRTGWSLLKSVYGNLGNGTIWSWTEITNNLPRFLEWLEDNEELLRTKGSFSNHRKFTSLSATYNSGTGASIKDYIQLIGQSHLVFIENIDESIRNNPKELFKYLYDKLNSVKGFGRLAKFDFLSMLGKIEIIAIEPDSPYISNSTGPKNGAKLLYDLPNCDGNVLNANLIELGNYLELDFAMQVIEDCICNWQKHTQIYQYFRG